MTRGAVFLLLAALLFSGMSVLVKLAGETLPSAMMVAARALVTLVMSLVWLRLLGVSPWGQQKKLLLLRGAFGFAGLACFFFAITRLPLAEVTVLHYVNPVITSVAAAVVLKEGAPRRLWVAITLSLAGVLVVTRPALLFTSPADLDGAGVVAALFGAVASAGAYVTVRRLRSTEHPLVIVLWFSMVALPASVPLVAPVFVWPEGMEWLLLVAIGVITQLAQVCLTKGLTLVPAGPATTLGYVQIVFAAGWGALLFEEELTGYTAIGTLLVLFGAVVVLRSQAAGMRAPAA